MASLVSSLSGRAWILSLVFAMGCSGAGSFEAAEQALREGAEGWDALSYASHCDELEAWLLDLRAEMATCDDGGSAPSPSDGGRPPGERPPRDGDGPAGERPPRDGDGPPGERPPGDGPVDADDPNAPTRDPGVEAPMGCAEVSALARRVTLALDRDCTSAPDTGEAPAPSR